jgi:hypothetical protein
VTGTTTSLSSLGADDYGENNLTYTWSTQAKPAGAADVVFSANGTNAAKSATATFNRTGNYTLRLTITDRDGGSVTSDVTVTVNPTATGSLTVTPNGQYVAAGSTLQLNASPLVDQFGQAVPVTWSTTAGAITNAGLLTTPNVSGTVTVTASGGGLSGQATVFSNTAPTVTSVTPAQSNLTGTSTTLAAVATDDFGEGSLTYTWTTFVKPATAPNVVFSANGSNNAKNTTATFGQAGNYTLTLVVTDAGGLTRSQNVNVLVVQSAANAITLTSPSTYMLVSGQQQFTASALDQFGQPVAMTWSSSAGTISSNGLLTAPVLPQNTTVTVTGGNRTAQRTVQVDVAQARAAWLFNEGSGTTVIDATGNGRNGTATNTTWTTGQNGGNALAFNGATSKGRVTFETAPSPSPSLAGTTDFTISAWVRTTATTEGVIIQQRSNSANGYIGQYRLSVNADGTLRFWVYGTNGTQSNSHNHQFNGGNFVTSSVGGKVNDGQWHLVTAVRQGTVGRIYIDGVLKATSTAADNVVRALDATIPVAVGADVRDNSRFFNGSIDNVRIYESALSGDQILALKNHQPS